MKIFFIFCLFLKSHAVFSIDTKAILVTGGAGYIGSHTSKALYEKGYKPVVIDNLSQGREDFVKWGPFEKADLRDEKKLQEIVEIYHPIGVFHFAASIAVGESVQKPLDFYENNILGTLNLLKACVKNNIKNFVFSSSCAVYGEPQFSPFTEAHVINPKSPYAETKHVCEKMLEWCEKPYGMHFAMLRYFNASGADEGGFIGEQHYPETHLIPLAIQASIKGEPIKIFGDDYPTKDGTCVRDYIHVTDLADAHLKAFEYVCQKQESVTLNLGSGIGYTVKEVIDTVSKITSQDVPFEIVERREGDPSILLADISRARNTLNWEPKHSSLSNIVKTAYAWEKTRIEATMKL
jgi:UDP-glucose 4-epimerase